MNYTAAQVAKFIASVVTGLSTVGVAVATAMSSDSRITGDEWAVIIPLISGAIITALAVFTVPNGLTGDE